MGNYTTINGLHFYYEVHGEGKPLVLIHGGGSTIESCFGRIIPLLAKTRQVIAAEMQAHGRTGDRDVPLSFQQDADDIAALLTALKIDKADVLGFSNGGQTAIEFALRHTAQLNKLVICSAFYKRSAAPQQFWEGFQGEVPFSSMPAQLADAFLKVHNDQKAVLTMFKRDVERMRNFKDWTDEQIKSISAPTFIFNATTDVGSVEHAVNMYRLISNAELAILPGGHGAYLGEIMADPDNDDYIYTARLIDRFLRQ